MDWMNFATERLGWLPQPVIAWLERQLPKIPPVRRQIEKEYDTLMAEMEPALKPYRGTFPDYTNIPESGRSRNEVLAEMEALHAAEAARWQDGYASGAVYHGDPEHIAFLNRVYALHSQSNPLHADLWPSAGKFEAEIVAMTAAMLGANETDDDIVGTVSSGGTESILLAMKTYRDRARVERGITHPELVIPVTAHAAFHKAAGYFQIKLVEIPVDANFRADVAAAERAINANTIALVGSAPSFPHGMIDPIPALAALAHEHNIGLHVDACLGGFVLPWAEKLGYDLPLFDFRLPGVTSISADTHKYGYAAKGTSVILYRGRDLRHYQYFTIADWPGGLYFSPTFAGSRPGALSAACWAALVTNGVDGYTNATARILDTAATIKQGIWQIPELEILGDPLWVIAFTSRDLDIYRIMEEMEHRGWSLNGLHRPPAIHLAVTLRHTRLGVADRFLLDLRDAVAHVRAHPDESGTTAPVYGMAATIPLRGMVRELLKRYIDLLYKVR